MQTTIKRLIIITAFLSLLTGCRGVADRWQQQIIEFFDDPPEILAPPTPALAPTTVSEATPTLAAAADDDETAAGPDAEVQPPAAETPDSEAEAPGADEGSGELGPFTGTFAGTVTGENDSSATLQLELVQRGRQIEGTATIGEGLVVEAGGLCGSFPIPATTLSASDELDQVDGRRLSTTSDVEVSGFVVPVELEATLSPDGQTVEAVATVYPPALCTNDPTVTATLRRVEN